MFDQLIQSIVRILDKDGVTVGIGFVITTSGLIATCSHVIQHDTLQKQGAPRPEKISVVFHATGDEQDALIESQWWLPWNAGDLAIIRVEGTLPQGIQPLPLGHAEGTSGHEISTFGFPDIGISEGLGGDGRVVRVLLEAGRPVLQLRSREITVGFSGAPVWDLLGRRVIGIVSALTEPDRHHRLAETVFAISTETLQTVCPTLQVSEVCPYRGLAVFTEADTEFFFGRQQIIDGLLNRLRRDPRFLMVLGPSGSGKSSIVQAGFIPQVRCGKVLGSDRRGIILTRPATQPFEELTKQGVMSDTHDLLESVHIWLSEHPEQERLLIVIDQFEEVFSMCPEAIRQDFVMQLVKLLDSPLPITVVLVMRDDFYSRLTQQATFIACLERSGGPIHVPRFLKYDELIDMIKEPSETVGLKFEEGLVEAIVKDTLETSSQAENGGYIGRSAVLPLLEFALTELWERRQGGMLTHEAYHNIGEVTGALSQWADRAFYALKQDEQRLAQRIFTDLVYMGDKGQGILDSRRRRTLLLLYRNGDEQVSVERVVQHLAKNRLLVTDRDLQSNEETVEIIHDVLLREWGQLQKWLEKDRRFLSWHQEFEKLALGWVTQSDRSKLLRGRDLTEAKGWLKEREADLSKDEATFLHASIAHHVWSVVSIFMTVLLLMSTTGLAGWYYIHQSPDATRVTNLQDNDKPGSLRYAIAEALPKSTITFNPDLHGTILLTNGDLIIAKDLMIRGPGVRILSVSGGQTGHFVHVVQNTTVTIFDLAFKDSQTSNGIIENDGTLTLNKSIISGNVLGKENGDTSGIENGGMLTLNNSIVSNNAGAGIAGGTGTLVLNHSVISNNAGGGIFGINVATLTNSIVSDNKKADDGEGGSGISLFNGILTLTNSIVSGNRTIGDGGGISSFGVGSVLTLTNSTISGNEANSGGGIFIDGGMLRLTNSTISDNVAIGGDGSIFNNGGGGGITVSDKTIDQPMPVQAMLLYCTVYNNSAKIGGGIWFTNDDQTSQMAMEASIVAGNKSRLDPDMNGSLTTLGYNLIGNLSGAKFLGTTQAQSTDRLRVPLSALKVDPVLRDNGRSAQLHSWTHALLSESPAIDLIPTDICMTFKVFNDQRSVKRPQGKGCDSGAYEYVPI